MGRVGGLGRNREEGGKEVGGGEMKGGGGGGRNRWGRKEEGEREGGTEGKDAICPECLGIIPYTTSLIIFTVMR